MVKSNLKKKQKPEASDNDVDVSEVNVEEFIPYACHFNDNTILTKNGELLQVIKVTGFAFESVHNEKNELLVLRDAIRNAIFEHIKTNDFAVWFHTIRRRKNLAPEGEYEEGFSDDLNRAWCERHDWEHKYTNELYVTIMIEGQSLSLTDVMTFLRSLYFTLEFKYRAKYLESILTKLTKTVDGIFGTLENYGAERLGIVKKDGIYYSEILSFLSKIVNLKGEPIPMTAVDLSNVLPSHKISFGHNILEVKGSTGRHLGAILTVKEYHEVSTFYIDEFLQLPLKFVITETFDFVNRKGVIKHFENQRRIGEASGDADLVRSSGLTDILDSDNDLSTDYGEHQITIMILEDSVKLLTYGLEQMVSAINELGVVVIREDVFLEDCYWSQLPGNFEFLKRMSPISSQNIGGYASLYNFPAGRMDSNHWGSALTVFYTASGTPYLFNFHYGDNGHTFIIGPYGAGKTVLMNFLVSEASKYKTRLFFFDQQRGSEIFIRVVEGKYLRITRDAAYTNVKFNPLLIDDSPENRKFLESWFCYLIASDQYDAVTLVITDEEREKIKKAVEYVFSLAREERKLSTVLKKFWPLPDEFVVKKMDTRFGKSFAELNKEMGSIPERVSIWYGDGDFAHIFDNVEDTFHPAEHLKYGFDVTHMVEDGITLIPVMFYIMHRINESIDGTPTIIVLDEAWALIDNHAFADHIGDWLDDLQSKNAMVIFATESVDGAEKSTMTRVLAKKIETKIFLPNPDATVVGYEEVFGLSDREFKILGTMSIKRREFLLKHNIDAVVAVLNLGGMDYELAVLASTQETLALMEGAIQDRGEDPAKWLPVFKERLFS